MKDIAHLIVVGMSVAAWLTGIANCLLTGAFFGALVEFFVFPIGVIHGIVLWVL
jgi:hypothetical protein